MHRHRIGFGLLALGAAVLAACSTGGGGSSIVPSFAVDARHRRPAVRAVVYLRIPAPRHHHRRGGGRRMHPNYVSPGTASISFAVQPIAAGSSSSAPTPMPLQTMNVVTPAPCATISPTDAALQCKFTVSVMPGRDSFVVKTYTAANASGKVLSEYTSGSTIIPTPNPKGNVVPLGFTLEGAVDHVVLQYPNSVVPADAQGQIGAIPVGVATAVPLNVTPYDAANYQILSQVPAGGTPVPYAAPVTLSVSPTGKGFTLSNASGSGNSVTISGPNDLAVAVDYDGTFTASGGSLSSTSSFSVAATGSTLAARPHKKKIDPHALRAATPAPDAAGIVLSGNAIPGSTVPTTLTTTGPLSLVNVGATNNMAFFAYGYAGAVVNGLMGTTSGGVPSTSGLFAGNLANANFADHLGNLWVYDHNTDQIDCFAPGSYSTPAGSIPTASLFPGGGSLYDFNGFVEDSSNNLWFALYGSVAGFYFYTIGDVPINATSCSAPAASISITQPPTDAIYLYDLTPIPGTGSVAVGSYDFNTSTGSILVATKAVATPSVTSAALGFGAQPEAMFTGPTSAYTLLSSSGQSLGSVSATGAYTNIATYDATAQTFLYSTSSKAASASGVLGATANNTAYSDTASVLLLNPADSNPSTNFEALPFGKICQGVAFDAQDTAWAFCLNDSNVLQLFHVVPTSTWSVLPGTVVPVNLRGSVAPYTGSVYLGILEAFGSTAGPFTLKNYDTSVISNVGNEGDRGITFDMSENSLGSAASTADVVDASGRSVTVTFEINAVYYAGAPPRHGAQARARRGYPPIPHN